MEITATRLTSAILNRLRALSGGDFKTVRFADGVNALASLLEKETAHKPVYVTPPLEPEEMRQVRAFLHSHSFAALAYNPSTVHFEGATISYLRIEFTNSTPGSGK